MLRKLLTSSILGTAAAAACAQALPSPPALLTKAIAAAGRLGAARKIELSGSVTRTLGSEVESGTVDIVANSDGSSTLTLAFPSATETETYSDLDNIAVCSDTASSPLNLSPVACLSQASWFFPFFLMLDAVTAAHYYVALPSAAATWLYVHPLGAGSDSARPVSLASDRRLLFDPASYLPSSYEYPLHFGVELDNTLPASVRFSDYRSANGVMLPYRIERRVNNSTDLVITVQSASVS